MCERNEVERGKFLPKGCRCEGNEVQRGNPLLVGVLIKRGYSVLRGSPWDKTPRDDSCILNFFGSSRFSTPSFIQSSLRLPFFHSWVGDLAYLTPVMLNEVKHLAKRLRFQAVSDYHPLVGSLRLPCFQWGVRDPARVRFYHHRVPNPVRVRFVYTLVKNIVTSDRLMLNQSCSNFPSRLTMIYTT